MRRPLSWYLYAAGQCAIQAWLLYTVWTDAAGGDMVGAALLAAVVVISVTMSFLTLMVTPHASRCAEDRRLCREAGQLIAAMTPGKLYWVDVETFFRRPVRWLNLQVIRYDAAELPHPDQAGALLTWETFSVFRPESVVHRRLDSDRGTRSSDGLWTSLASPRRPSFVARCTAAYREARKVRRTGEGLLHGQELATLVAELRAAEPCAPAGLGPSCPK